MTTLADYDVRPPCRACGPGHRIGDEGCRHGEYQPEIGETAICRTCVQPIWWEVGEVGHRERIGWSDRIKRGGDSVVCFKARDYRHVPMGGREAAAYEAGFKAGQKTTLADYVAANPDDAWELLGELPSPHSRMAVNLRQALNLDDTQHEEQR